MPKVQTRPAPRQEPRRGAGRKPIPHPFLGMARQIMGRVERRTGAPIAAVHHFAAKSPAELATLRQRFRRQLTRVGKELRPDAPVRLYMRIEPASTEEAYPRAFTLLFWDIDAGR